MSVRDAVLAVLASIPPTACQDTTSCLPDPEGFSIDEPLSPEQIERLVSIFDLPDQEAIACDDACRAVYSGEVDNEAHGYRVSEVDSCSLSVPPDPGDEGHLSCTGKGYEYSACTP